MVEMPGGEYQIKKIIHIVNQEHGDVYYRKTIDSNGDDYFLILNSQGEEVAEWDDTDHTWHQAPYPRPTADIQNCTNITSLKAQIEKLILSKGMLASQTSTCRPKV
ncbi:hypothetical protein ACIPT9_10260 [Pectobacterium carotovorum]|uniref:hypothetical protein n=1 Tax=Pectobacterium carotovorum TaxID=554 RepID=UPI003818A3D3